jgi:diguanylate cyclase (GGDEF)-like protein/PAS domain S-box-containing protein
MHSPARPSNRTYLSTEQEAPDLIGPLPAPGFDRITGLAARLLGVSTVGLSLSDSDRGRLEPCGDIASSDTPCAYSLGALASVQAGPLVVADASQDERFRHHPHVIGAPHIRFYAGIPVRARSGAAVGAMCLSDPTPRVLRADELATLTDLADLVGQEIQYRDRLAIASDLVRRANALPKITSNARRRDLQEANRALVSAVALQAETEQALRVRQAELDNVLEHAMDAYVCNDAHYIVIGWNRQAERMFGWSKAEALGQSIFALMVPPEVAPSILRDSARFADTGASDILHHTVEFTAERKNGQRIIIELQVQSVEVNGRAVYHSFARDISARKAAEAQREYEAMHDALTGLQNRRALLEVLPLAQARAQRSEQALALLFIDLDGFKAVNDNLGHEAGDEVLCVVAQRLSTSIRATDQAYRLAGDEFTVILENVQHGPEDARRVAEKLIVAISEPIHVKDTEARIGASIGIAMYRADNTMSVQGLISEADAWMYRAKQAGRGQVFPRPQPHSD